MRSKILSAIALAILGIGTANGFQSQTADESVLFHWVVRENRFEIITPGDIQPKNLYMRWDNGLQTHVWVSGDNRDLILSSTKVQGGRLGFTGQEARNWYLFTEGTKPGWKKNTERTRPEMWRWDPKRVVGGSFTTGIYRSERTGDGWETWGGDLDPVVVEPPPIKPPPVDPPPIKPPPIDPPPPSNELTCQVSASPSTAKVGETILLSMKTTGPVISATLDGAAVDFPSVMRAKSIEVPVNTPLPAKVKISGQVKAPNMGRAECSVEITVVTN